MIRNVLFDVDGTLYSSESIILAVYEEEFARWRAEFGRPARAPSLSEIVAQIGKPVPEIFAALTPELPLSEQTALADRILENLVARVAEGQGEHYPGAADAVRECHRRGLRLFTLSNGRFLYVESVLVAAGIRSCFEAVPHLDGMGVSTKGALAARVLDVYKLIVDETIVIGDRASDRDAALENGIPFLACTYGHGNADEWAGAWRSVDHPSAIVGALEAFADG